MRIKSVNFFELHVEKLVLGLAALFSAFVLWAYVWGVPYTAAVGSNPRVAPGQIEQKVLDQERRLNELIGPGSTSPLPSMKVPGYTAMFQYRLRRALFATQRLDPISQPGLAYNQFRLPDRPIGDQFDVPTPHAPLWPRAIAGFGVLQDHQQLADHYAQLAERTHTPQPRQYGQGVAAAFDELVPSQEQPRDFRYITVGALYHIDAWRQLLETSGGVPEEWWRGKLASVDIALERQTFDPATGQWGDAVLLEPIPGAVSFRGKQASWTKEQAKQAIETIIEQQEQVQRPSFAPMTDATRWSEPDLQPDGLSFQIQQQIDILAKKIEQFKNQIRRAPPEQQSIFDLTDPTNINGPPMSIKQLKQELEVHIKRRKGLQEQAQQLTEQSPSLADLNDRYKWWRVWAHDYTVQPGQTYRYRVRVALINPLFQRSQLVAEQRQAYFHKLSLESETSEWSPRVSIEPEHRFFLVGGSGAEMLARVEVWRVINGKPRKAEFRVKAGDPIGGIVKIDAGALEVNADMRIDALVVDLQDVPSPRNLDRRTTQLLYLNLKTNRLEERIAELDRESPIYKQLEDLSSSGASVAEANGITTTPGVGVR